MGSYYYLMAQLPYLVFDQKPPMSSGEFKELAKNLMNKSDAGLLDELSLDYKNESATSSRFINSWQEWERALRLNAARHRASVLHRQDTQDAPPVPMDAAAAAAKAVNSDSNPLESEIIIDKARWNAIEEFAGNDYFCRDQAFAYYIKLLLLERRQAQDNERGFSEYKNLYEQISAEANASEGFDV